jgi:uncharacterized protein DUF5916/cellulose/xylan binding protein with CBM9 domain
LSLRFKISISVVWFTFVSILLEAQENEQVVPKRIYTTKGINNATPPVIDGILNDEIWDIVPWGGDFIELQPDENTPPTQQTKFKIIYDDKFLYIGVRAIDTEPDKIVKRLSRRDGFDGDYVEIHIDSYHDLRSGFSFTTTAAGVKGDQFISKNGNNFDNSWNPIWYTKSNIDDKGWTAEMKIPLSQLRFGKSEEQIWGIQVMRRLFREEELSVWQRVPVNSPGWVSEFGELHGLINLKPQKQIEIQPYVLTQYDTRPKEEGNPFQDGDDFTLSGGLDAKIGITNDLTLDLTVNPDFGQVEADPAAIALDGFEIFFREQRPFFVENKNIFDFQFADNQDNVFFSRRIGRSPQGFPSTNAGEFVDQPRFTTILGAAKFSGKTKKGWSIGILESVTAKEYAEIDNNGKRRKELVEPLTNYFVGRLQKDFNNNNSFIGGIFTATNRKIEGNLDFLRTKAYTGGFDFKHQWKERKYYVDGNFIVSNVQGSKESITRTQESLTHLFQRVDAKNVSVDPNRTSLTGTGGRVEAGKAGSGHWSYNGGFLWRSPELELNDIGFLRRADNMKQYANLRYQTLKPFGRFRIINARFAQFTTYDFDGNYNRLQLRLTSFAQFKNYWWTNIGFQSKPRIFSNSTLRGGPRFKFSNEYTNWWFVGSDSRKKLRFDLGYVISQAEQDHFSLFRLQGGITYQPLNALNFSINPRFEYAPNKTQYVTEKTFKGDPRFITAEIENQTLSASVRINYTINPNLTIQYYAEPFISRGNYSNFNYITNSVADDLYDRFELYNDNQIVLDDGIYNVDEDRDGNTDYSFREPDFAFVQYNSNLVLRWEYIPGSEIFLVWSQGIVGFGDPNDSLFESIDKEILQQKPNNTYLIKATFRYVF